jgi:hypothetical protein
MTNNKENQNTTIDLIKSRSKTKGNKERKKVDNTQ